MRPDRGHPVELQRRRQLSTGAATSRLVWRAAEHAADKFIAADASDELLFGAMPFAARRASMPAAFACLAVLREGFTAGQQLAGLDS